MRALFSLLLCFSLATTSVSAAVMHSEMQGALQMVICSDIGAEGLVTLTIDATGKPIQTHHDCPDCTAAMAALLWDQGRAIAPQTADQIHYPAKLTAGTGRPGPIATARGPPLFV